MRSIKAGKSAAVYRARFPMIVAPLKASLCFVDPEGIHHYL